jgi:hypothetical protein
MRVTVLALASSAALAFATTAFADTDMTSVTPEPMAMSHPISATTANDSKTVICHHLIHEGTLMPQQVCLTKHSWELMRAETQRTVSDFEVHSFVVPMK